MAKKSIDETEVLESVETTKEKNKEINMNDSSYVKNICTWTVSYSREISVGDENFKELQTKLIPNREIESQFMNNNVFYVGTGNGNHARFVIKDELLKEHLIKAGLLDKDAFILTEDICRDIINSKTMNEFKRKLDEFIIEKFEGRMFVDVARKLKLNEYDKIKEIEKRFNVKF